MLVSSAWGLCDTNENTNKPRGYQQIAAHRCERADAGNAGNYRSIWPSANDREQLRTMKWCLTRPRIGRQHHPIGDARTRCFLAGVVRHGKSARLCFEARLGVKPGADSNGNERAEGAVYTRA